MFKNKKYLILLLLLCFFPTTLFHILIIPWWEGDTAMSTKASLYSLIFTACIIPIYTLTINYILASKYKIFNIILITCLTFINVFLSSYLRINNWKNTKSGTFETGNETDAVINFEIWIGIIISIIGLIVIYFNRPEKAHSRTLIE